MFNFVVIFLMHLRFLEERLENVFRARYLSKISRFLAALTPTQNSPTPAQYQKDFAAWDLYQVGPDYTQELLEAVGIRRKPWCHSEQLLRHYVADEVEKKGLICSKAVRIPCSNAMARSS